MSDSARYSAVVTRQWERRLTECCYLNSSVYAKLIEDEAAVPSISALQKGNIA